MSFWTAVVVIAAIIAVTEMTKARYRSRNGITRDHWGNETLQRPEDSVLQREVEDLRERVKVLERITTEANTSQAINSRRVADEIESLRERS